jgi:hypothetical protein
MNFTQYGQVDVALAVNTKRPVTDFLYLKGMYRKLVAGPEKISGT